MLIRILVSTSRAPQSIVLSIFIEKLRLFAHVVDSPSHKGIARRALPASGGKDAVGGNKIVNKGE